MIAEDCIFCKIVSKVIPSQIVFENENNIGFLDIFPISKGHTVVIPKEHYKNIEDIPEEVLSSLIVSVKKIAKLIHEKLNIDGYNILQNNFKSAGQVVEHFHIHIIPRNYNDERFKLIIPRDQASQEELSTVLELLSS